MRCEHIAEVGGIMIIIKKKWKEDKARKSAMKRQGEQKAAIMISRQVRGF